MSDGDALRMCAWVVGGYVSIGLQECFIRAEHQSEFGESSDGTK